jgi:hypothetical protein
MASARLTLDEIVGGALAGQPYRRCAGEGDGGHRPGAVQHPLRNNGDSLGGPVREEDRGLAVDGRYD